MPRIKRIQEKVAGTARVAVVTAVVVSPWLFGSADPWAYLLICLLVGVGVAAWLFSLICDPQAELRSPRLTLLLAALLAYVLLQMMPLPSSVVKILSPASAEAQRAKVEVFEHIEGEQFLPSVGNDNLGSATISASAAATQRSFYLLAAYIGVFLVMAHAFTKWAQLRKAASAIVISSLAIAVLGIIHKFSGDRTIFWFHVPRFGGAIFGPFTNPNHYAAYANMAFGTALGLLLTATATAKLRARKTWRQKVAWLSTGKASQAILLAFAAILMGASVCVSLSRGGITSLAASLGLAGVFVTLSGAAPNRGRIVAAVALLVVAAVVWLGWQPVVKELGTLAEIDPVGGSRTEATLATLRIFRTWPVFGCGFGSFQHVFPAFQGPSIQFGRWLHAHNDYAQLIAEGGIVGVLLVVLTAVVLVRLVRKRFSKAAREGRLFVGGLAVGLAAIALHSFVDYSLHKPANAFLLATLCGMSVAAAHLRSEQKKRTFLRGHHRSRRSSASALDNPDAALRHLVIRAGAMAALVALAVLALAELSELRGELAFARFYRMKQLADKSSYPTDLTKAVRNASAEAELVMLFSKRNPDALWGIIVPCLRWSASEVLDPLLRLRLAEKATRAAALAVRAAPSDFEPWLWFARTQAALGLREHAQLCLKRAQELAPPRTKLELLEAQS